MKGFGLLRVVLLLSCWLLWASCTEKKTSNLFWNPQDTSLSFVDKRYYQEKPLAQLINLPVFADSGVGFELAEDTRVQVYGVGELVYNLSEGSPDYFFKGDDMAFFFEGHSYDKFVFTWADGKPKGGKTNFTKQGATFFGYQLIDSINSKYIAEVKFSWDSLDVKKPKARQQIGFDIAIGDNDDEYKQKAKIYWASNSDLLQTNKGLSGNIFLAGPNMHDAPKNHSLQSVYNSITVDGIIDDVWEKCPVVVIKNKVFGEIRDSYDLFATVRCCWDNKGLYFLVEVQDENRRIVWPDQFRQTQTLLDYGWIEKQDGQKVWEMNALDTRPAGGAVKNQKVDTIVALKKGKYFLKYSSDESHAYGNWDDDPPATPFYGIVVFRARK